MMKVQKYLEEHGLEKLKSELFIRVTDYPDRVVLNYDQIESPKFDPIVIECRALILRKGTWEVMARAFNRFFNIMEDQNYRNFPVAKARIEQKIDGSLIDLYWDGEKWCIATRKMAFGEGQSVQGNTFADIFRKAVEKTSLWVYLDEYPLAKTNTYTFELVSPETRVVTPYPEIKVFFTGCRQHDGHEKFGNWLDSTAKIMHIDRPQSFRFNSIEETIAKANELAAMDEGFVLVFENDEDYYGSHWRLKCKNAKYLAISHLRCNGGLSPKRVLKLVMENDVDEYLSYFPEDRVYFDFVQQIWGELVARVQSVYEECKGITSQKDFALAIMPRCKYGFESGAMFQCRKSGQNLVDILRGVGHDKVSKGIGLRKLFLDNFKIELEEE